MWNLNNFNNYIQLLTFTHYKLYTTVAYSGLCLMKVPPLHQTHKPHNTQIISPNTRCHAGSFHALISLLWFLLCIHREPNLIPFMHWIWYT